MVRHDAGGQGFSHVGVINDAGWSVGYSATGSSSYEAVLWSPAGKATDLGAVLGSAWTETYATGLNDSGDIIGYGDYHGGVYGFLLTPDPASALSATAAPEPSTWAMLLAGFVGLGFAAIARRRAGGLLLPPPNHRPPSSHRQMRRDEVARGGDARIRVAALESEEACAGAQ